MSLRLPFGCFVQVVRPGTDGCADWPVLQRREFIRVILPLGSGRALIAGRLAL